MVLAFIMSIIISIKKTIILVTFKVVWFKSSLAALKRFFSFLLLLKAFIIRSPVKNYLKTLFNLSSLICRYLKRGKTKYRTATKTTNKRAINIKIMYAIEGASEIAVIIPPIPIKGAIIKSLHMTINWWSWVMSLVLLLTKEVTPKLLTCSFEAKVILVNKAFLTLAPNLAAILAIKKLAMITELELIIVSIIMSRPIPIILSTSFCKTPSFIILDIKRGRFKFVIIWIKIKATDKSERGYYFLIYFISLIIFAITFHIYWNNLFYDSYKFIGLFLAYFVIIFWIYSRSLSW